MSHLFNVEDSLRKIRHYLPAQAPLKDFVHHNTLHAFDDKSFFEALQLASEVFGYKTSLSLGEYQELYRKGRISDSAINFVIQQADSIIPLDKRKELMLSTNDDPTHNRRIGELRKRWKSNYKIDLSSPVHLNLFRLVGSYLDQGISASSFPVNEGSFLESIIYLNTNSFFKFFKSSRVRDLIAKKDYSIESLLMIIVGKECYFEQYLFDQQFEHPGWSGMVSVIEENPDQLFERKIITLSDFIILELLLEIDFLDTQFKVNGWKPIAISLDEQQVDLFEKPKMSLRWELKSWWQQSLEWNYYDQVVKGVGEKYVENETSEIQFQAFFCIDDREESIRRHIELIIPTCQTFGSPAHFNLPIYYRPAGGKFNTQVCPGPIDPKHIIIDDRDSEKHERDLHFHQSSHGFLGGWMISQTLGFWSAFRLFVNIFKPTISPAHSSSFEHMSHRSQLIIEHSSDQFLDNLQVGFTLDEMCNLVFSELKRSGLTENFAPLVYFFGHGGSSTNNPYYAGYNCGACSGRPSSLNARVFASMANRGDVRDFLSKNGVNIPNETQFVGGLHDTTRDEFVYYDIENLSKENTEKHKDNVALFEKALANNAKERARQFISIDIHKNVNEIHNEVKKRSMAFFEPRPELNHSNNCLCIVGSRTMTKKLFLDQRAFLNSYDWRSDTDGNYLEAILNAATPVCGGINLEYYFSRVDNENFGSGSKLPHNVIGLFGVANGVEGDLRTGLPIQMVEVHDPLRLMMIIEQKKELVESVLQKNPATNNWYQNEWVTLSVIDPESKEVWVFINGEFKLYNFSDEHLNEVDDLHALFETTHENLPVVKLS